ncbi:MAG TPA: hypothetical protein VHG08_12450, partial [Longimicrobium sp.]|nr:hypothetical protein [Longimicrobium sp.]
MREPGELLEGAHVLEEFPCEVALALWAALRDVMLWADTPRERRPHLFSAGAEARRRGYVAELRLDPAVELPLGTLASVVSHERQTSDEEVSHACLQLAGWAGAQNAMGTAVSFAQAAALVLPEAPAPGLMVGRLALAWGRLPRAETWLRRTVGLARRARDWLTYGSAYVSLGEIQLRSNRLHAAARLYRQAARVSRRHRVRLVRAQAMHGLVRASMEMGELEQAVQYARLARLAYGRSNPRLPELEFDMARLMMRRGEHERAIPVLQRQIDMMADPDRRLACGAMLARAAAEVGDRPLYERSWSAAWALLDGRRSPAAADALVHLGRAAVRTTDWLRVQQVVRAFGELPPDPSPSPAA